MDGSFRSASPDRSLQFPAFSFVNLFVVRRSVIEVWEIWSRRKTDFFAQDNWSIVHVAGDFSVYSVCDGHGINGALEQILMKFDQLSDSMQ